MRLAALHAAERLRSAHREPLQLSAHELPLSVAPDGSTFADSSLRFTFYAQAEPDAISPSSGPLAGGTAVTVSGAFPRLDPTLFAQGSAEAAQFFPEAACNFSGALVPATVVGVTSDDLVDNITLSAPPPPLMPPLSPPPNLTAAASLDDDALAAEAPPSPLAALPPGESAAYNASNASAAPPPYTTPPPPATPAVPSIPRDMVNRTLVCVSPYIGIGSLRAHVVERFSFGEDADAIAALRGAHEDNARALASSSEGHRPWQRLDGRRGLAEPAAGAPMREDVLSRGAAEGGGGVRNAFADGGEDDEDGEDDEAAGEGAAASMATVAVEPPRGFMPIDVSLATSSTSHPRGGRDAVHAIDGSGMRTTRDGRLVHGLCSGAHDLGCSGQCWMSDAAANSDEQWLQFDFGVERHVDMIQLYAFNSPHGSDALASLSAVDVQVPDASADGGWRTVGRIRHLPPAPLVDGDDGVNVRRRGLPVYFVPLQHSGSATLQTADWLGFESAAVRLAHMANHRRGYAATALGLCHVAFWEEDPSTSLQLLGSAAVRARMLQLTPGASFAAHAAHADMYLPPTTGEAALDASLRDMRIRLASTTGEEGALRKDDTAGGSDDDDDDGDGAVGVGDVDDEGGMAGVDEPAPPPPAQREHCAAAGDDGDDAQPAPPSPVVLLQSEMSALGDLTLEVAQTREARTGSGAAAAASYFGGHGELPAQQRPIDHAGRAPAARAESEHTLMYGRGAGGGGSGGGDECGGADEPGRPVTMRLTAAGWLPDASDTLPASAAARVRTRCRWATSDGATGGTSRFRSVVARTEAAQPIGRASPRRGLRAGGGGRAAAHLLHRGLRPLCGHHRGRRRRGSRSGVGGAAAARSAPAATAGARLWRRALDLLLRHRAARPRVDCRATYGPSTPGASGGGVCVSLRVSARRTAAAWRPSCTAARSSRAARRSRSARTRGCRSTSRSRRTASASATTAWPSSSACRSAGGRPRRCSGGSRSSR